MVQHFPVTCVQGIQTLPDRHLYQIYSVPVCVYILPLSRTDFTKNCWVLQEADADAALEEPTVYWVTRPVKDQKMRLQNLRRQSLPGMMLSRAL